MEFMDLEAPIKRYIETDGDVEPFKKRVKSTGSVGNASNALQLNHYGVPIYDLLREVESHAAAEPKATFKTTSTAILFTDKYAPQTYMDLQGSQDTQRHILRWISRWRPIAMGLEHEESEYTDSLGRPLKKILLVHGPPGAGKTTAINVMAKTEGFDVLEINASDDRGALAVQQRISSALFSHQALSDRPVCILADEVDGAESGFVRGLIELVKADSRRLRGEKSKKKSKDRLLQRPIIAVCNEAFGRALYDLRQYCEVVYFGPPDKSRILKRLEQISRGENLKTPAAVITQDIVETGGDFRACLNRLQYGGDRGSANKDRGISMADISTKIFNKENNGVLQDAEASGEADKLLEHTFEQYPRAYFVDDRFTKPASLGDWYALADNKRFSARSDYANATLGVFHTHFSSLSNAGLKYQRPVNIYQELRKTESILEQFRTKSSKNVRAAFTRRTTREELVTYAWQLACPAIGNVPTMSQKKLLLSCAQSLKDLGLRLRTERLEDGSSVHRLDAPVDLTCNLSEQDADFAAHGKYVHRSHLKTTMETMDMPIPELKVALPPTQPKSDDTKRSGFFGQTKVGSTPDRENRVWISYKEGFSNAVRKKISWNDLFL